MAAFLRELTDLSDPEVLDVLDVFGQSPPSPSPLTLLDGAYLGALEWPQVQLMLAAYTSLASHQTRRFLQVHGEAMFRVLARAPPQAASSSTISFREFAQLGLVFGVREDTLVRAILGEFKTEASRLREQQLTLEDFYVYYYAVLTRLDEHGAMDALTPEQFLRSSALCACIVQ